MNCRTNLTIYLCIELWVKVHFNSNIFFLLVFSVYQSFVFVVENWRLIFLSNRSDMYLLPTYLKYSCKYIKCDLWFLRTSEYQISFWSQKYINPWLFSNVFCLVNNIVSSILYIRKLCVEVHWFFEKHFYLNSFSTK